METAVGPFGLFVVWLSLVLRIGLDVNALDCPEYIQEGIAFTCSCHQPSHNITNGTTTNGTTAELQEVRWVHSGSGVVVSQGLGSANLTIDFNNTEICLDGWTLHENSGTCLQYFEVAKNWEEARAFCTDSNADLVRIPDQSMQTFLKDVLLMNASVEFPFFIGLHYEREFSWVEDNTKPSKSFWLPNEPDNSGGSDECVTMSKWGDRSWNDINCGIQATFVCEVGGYTNVGCPWQWTYNSYSHSCFRLFVDKRLDWHKAEQHCVGQTGHLAKINDAGTYYFVKSSILGNEGSWIGLRNPRYFHWLDDVSPLGDSYSAWSSGSPDLTSPSGQRRCAAMLSFLQGAWIDQMCGKASYFICQMPSVELGYLVQSYTCETDEVIKNYTARLAYGPSAVITRPNMTFHLDAIGDIIDISLYCDVYTEDFIPEVNVTLQGLPGGVIYPDFEFTNTTTNTTRYYFSYQISSAGNLISTCVAANAEFPDIIAENETHIFVHLNGSEANNTDPTTQTVISTTTSTINTTISTENTTTPIINTTISTENTTTPIINTTISTENTTIPIINTTISTENTPIPITNTTISTENTTIPIINTTISTENTPIPITNTTISTENTTTPIINTTIETINVTTSTNTTDPSPITSTTTPTTTTTTTTTTSNTSEPLTTSVNLSTTINNTATSIPITTNSSDTTIDSITTTSTLHASTTNTTTPTTTTTITTTTSSNPMETNTTANTTTTNNTTSTVTMTTSSNPLITNTTANTTTANNTTDTTDSTTNTTASTLSTTTTNTPTTSTPVTSHSTNLTATTANTFNPLTANTTANTPTSTSVSNNLTTTTTHNTTTIPTHSTTPTTTITTTITSSTTSTSPNSIIPTTTTANNNTNNTTTSNPLTSPSINTTTTTITTTTTTTPTPTSTTTTTITPLTTTTTNVPSTTITTSSSTTTSHQPTTNTISHTTTSTVIPHHNETTREPQIIDPEPDNNDNLNLCICPCNDRIPNFTNLTDDQMRDYRSDLHKLLSVDVDSLSITIRKKNCAKDYRSSSLSMGLFGASLLFITFGGIFVSDIWKIKRDILYFHH